MTGACVCCGGQEHSKYLRVLVRCPRCTHVWAPVELTDEDQRALYGETYFRGGEYRDYADESSALRRNFRARVRDLAELAPRGGRLWEIGAAYGFFLDEARRAFDVSGCDISEHAAGVAREQLKLKVCAGDYLEMPLDGGYDAVCAWDVVEHLARPDLYLKKACGDLRPGGVVALSTGDIGSFAAFIRGEKWRLIHPPSHIHYFTKTSIETLLKRVGFDVVRVQHDAFWRNARSVGRALLPEGVFRICERALGFDFPVNLFDLMTVYARKAN